jgi:TolA-binding protein
MFMQKKLPFLLKKTSLFVLVAFSLLNISACSVQRLDDEMDRLKISLKDVRSQQAEQTTKISALEDEVRKITGNIQEIQYSTDQKIGRSIENLQGDVSLLRKRVPPPSIVPEAEFAKDEESLAGLPTELSGPVAQGLESLREGNFERALAYWDEALDLGAGTDWESLAMFWRAVTLEGLQRSSDAVQEYLTLVKRFPKYKRAPLALYRQASLLLRLGDKKVARLALTKLMSDYPKSAEAALAHQLIKDI